MSESSESTQSRFFRAWGEVVVSRRWLVLLGVAAFTALCMFQIATKLHIDNSPEAFMDSRSEAAIALEDFRDIFGRDDVVLLLIRGDVFSKPYLDKLATLHEELGQIDLELESLGERKSDRDRARGRVTEATRRARPAEAAPDDFDDFDSFDSGGGDWGDEEGGSIIDEVISLINVRKIRASADGIDVGDLLDPMPTTPDEIAAIRRQVLGDPEAGRPADSSIVGQVVSADGRHSAIVLRTQFMSEPDSLLVSEHVQGIVARYTTPDFFIHLAGLPPLNAALQHIALTDMQTLTLIMLLLIGVVLLFMFVHPMGAVVPMVVVAASAIWALGLMAALGMSMTMLSNIIPSFLICVGVADSVHLISVYRQGVLAGVDSAEAAKRAVAGTGMPIFFTTITTAVGLLSFQFASVDAIGEMGLIGAAGVFAAFLNTVTLLPALLSFNRKSVMGADRPRRMGAIDGFLRLCAGLSSGSDGRRRATLAVAAGVTAVALYGASLLYVWHDPLTWVPPDHDIRLAFDAADEHLGGASAIQILIEGKGERGVKDIRLHQGLEKLEAYVEGFEHPRLPGPIVGSARSLTDILREIHQALHGGGPEEYRIPDDQAVIDNYFVLVESSGPDDLRRSMTLDARKTQMTIGTRWLEATSYLPLADYLEKGIAEFIPPDVADVTLTGTVYNVLSTVGQLLLDLMKTFILAFIVITAIMMVVLKSWRLGVIAMAPNLMPIAYILGLMGLADVPIDMSNLMIASIALGMAVDDTIHLCHHFRVHFAAHGRVEDAIQHALRHTGRALVVTSIILSAGFSVYLASVMESFQRFGLLIALTVIFAVVLDLTVTPALLRTVFRDRDDATPASDPAS